MKKLTTIFMIVVCMGLIAAETKEQNLNKQIAILESKVFALQAENKKLKALHSIKKIKSGNSILDKAGVSQKTFLGLRFGMSKSAILKKMKGLKQIKVKNKDGIEIISFQGNNLLSTVNKTDLYFYKDRLFQVMIHSKSTISMIPSVEKKFGKSRINTQSSSSSSNSFYRIDNNKFGIFINKDIISCKYKPLVKAIKEHKSKSYKNAF